MSLQQLLMTRPTSEVSKAHVKWGYTWWSWSRLRLKGRVKNLTSFTMTYFNFKTLDQLHPRCHMSVMGRMVCDQRNSIFTFGQQVRKGKRMREKRVRWIVSQGNCGEEKGGEGKIGYQKQT